MAGLAGLVVVEALETAWRAAAAAPWRVRGAHTRAAFERGREIHRREWISLNREMHRRVRGARTRSAVK